MVTPNEKLASSLVKLEELQKTGRRIFRSAELTRLHRERLVKSGFLREVMKGWLISSSPDANPGDTTPWYASFWEFCASYCTTRFGEAWHLSPSNLYCFTRKTPSYLARSSSIHREAPTTGSSCRSTRPSMTSSRRTCLCPQI